MNTLTVTEKGQTTIPVSIRRMLQLPKNGGILSYSFNEETGVLSITKTPTLSEIQGLAKSYLDTNIPPLEDARALYQESHQPRV